MNTNIPERRCENCQFWSSDTPITMGERPWRGECHANPPPFPQARPVDWCRLWVGKVVSIPVVRADVSRRNKGTRLEAAR